MCIIISFHAVPTNIIEAGIVQLDINAANSTVSCNLLSSYIETTSTVCSITYGDAPGDCEKYTDSSISTTGQPGVTLMITLSQDVNNGEEFCYTVSLNYGFTTVRIFGIFISGMLAMIIIVTGSESYNTALMV